jgi:N-acetylglutamate synthase-like GNAT family acetyltransferase
MNITISPYNEEYKQQIINLIISIQKNEFGIEVNEKDRPDLLNIHNSYINNNSGNFWVALYNNNVIGTISIIHISQNKLALQNMYIHKDFRGSMYNTATKLLKQTINFASQNDAKEIYLGTASDFYAAHKFYEKNGFSQVAKESLPTNFPIMDLDDQFFELIL